CVHFDLLQFQGLYRSTLADFLTCNEDVAGSNPVGGSGIPVHVTGIFQLLYPSLHPFENEKLACIRVRLPAHGYAVPTGFWKRLRVGVVLWIETGFVGGLWYSSVTIGTRNLL